MPLTKDEFEIMVDQIQPKVTLADDRNSGWEMNCIDVDDLYPILEEHIEKESHITVERVKGMIDKYIGNAESDDTKETLMWLREEINEAENV